MAEYDPAGTDPHQPGAKLDGGKPMMFKGLIEQFPHALASVAFVSAFGAEKYTWDGWQTVPDARSRYADALVRHLARQAMGEDRDDDSGLLHAAHAAWNALAVLELEIRDKRRFE